MGGLTSDQARGRLDMRRTTLRVPGYLENTLPVISLCGAAVAILVTSCTAGNPEADAAAPQSSEVIAFPSLGELQIYNEPGVGARMLQVDPTTIWRTLPEVYDVLEIPIEVMNESALELGNTGYVARRLEGKGLSSYLDCGTGASGPRADNYDVTLFVATRLIEQGPARTIVQTTVDGSARPRTVSGNPVHCASRGILEMRVAQLTAEALGIP